MRRTQSIVSTGLWLLLVVATRGTQAAEPERAEPAARLSPAELYERVSPAIVRVYRFDAQGIYSGQGSGFLISQDGRVITNDHVVSGGDSWQVVTVDNRVFAVRGIIANSARADLAILQAEGRWFPYVKLATNPPPSPGQKVLAIGNPLGYTNTISDGLLSGYRERANMPRMMQISAPVSEGSSGGPLFVDGSPEVVGVTTMVVEGGQNLNFAVPVREISKLMRSSSSRLTMRRATRDDDLLQAVKSVSSEEVQRILAGRVKHDQTTDEIVQGEEERQFFHWTIDPGLLVAGNNLLAVEIHQRGAISSDLSFDMQLTALGEPARVLVPTGSVWRYLDDGSDQGAVWIRPEFDDTSWKSGPAKLGYGDDDIVTSLSFGPDENQKFITTFFRHVFSLDDSANIRQLTLSLQRDDGAVIYLNGHRVVTDNLRVTPELRGQDEQGRTAMHWAVETGAADTLQAIVKAGGAINSQTSDGTTATDLALGKQQEAFIAAIRQLGGLTSAELVRLQAAMEAVKQGDLATVEQALAAGINVNAQDDVGATLLHYAVFADQAAIADWLLDHGANLEASDVDGYRPVHVAAANHRHAILEKLLERGAEPDARKADGLTSLMDACQTRDAVSAGLLLEHRADPNARSTQTGTPVLHIALVSDEIVEDLIAHGADVNSLDRTHTTALLMAARRGLDDAADMLRQAGAKACLDSPLPRHGKTLAGDLVNAIGMAFRKVPAGEFSMGSPAGEVGRKDDERQHTATVTKGFQMGVTEVTREQFELFIAETGHEPYVEKTKQSVQTSNGRVIERDLSLSWQDPAIDQSPSDPVVLVSWNDAAEFCRWLAVRESRSYRLPTEAEWELACRGGTTTAYSTGDRPEDLGAAAWFDDRPSFLGIRRSRGTTSTRAVALGAPNSVGLFDMHGNVREWIADWYGPLGEGQAVDPCGPETGTQRVHRGGAWDEQAAACRSANRAAGDPRSGYVNVGFRVVLE